MSAATNEQRPFVHARPRVGWLNDPHAGVWVDGHYHLFAQWNPGSVRHENVHWAHLVSSDLLVWQEQPPALSPGTEPQAPDRDGCWSGTTVRTDEGAVLVYTGFRRDEPLQTICLATSRDGGRTFVKDAGNPVLRAPAELELVAFRDPFVWWDGSGWQALVGAGFADRRAAALRFSSPDLRAWTYEGVFADSSHPALSATGAAGLGSVWECPQLLVHGERAALVVSVWEAEGPQRVMTMHGRLEGGSFVPEGTRPYDDGPDLYAPALGRENAGQSALAWGWSWEALRDGVGEGASWAGVLTLPRRLALTADGELTVQPAPEVAALRGDASSSQVSGGELLLLGDCFELSCVLPPGASLRLRADEEGREGVDIGRDDDGVVYLDRSHATGGGGRGGRYCMSGPVGGAAGEVRLFVDRTVLELYSGGSSLTARAYPVSGRWWGVEVVSAEPLHLSTWQLRLPVDRSQRDPQLVADPVEEVGADQRAAG